MTRVQFYEGILNNILIAHIKLNKDKGNPAWWPSTKGSRPVFHPKPGLKPKSPKYSRFEKISVVYIFIYTKMTRIVYLNKNYSLKLRVRVRVRMDIFISGFTKPRPRPKPSLTRRCLGLHQAIKITDVPLVFATRKLWCHVEVIWKWVANLWWLLFDYWNSEITGTKKNIGMQFHPWINHDLYSFMNKTLVIN
jgi:hypothetical protein